MRSRWVGATVAGALVLGVAAPAPAQEEPSEPPPAYEVVLGGLNNPRKIELGQDGALYVAEAGTGGDGGCIIAAEGDEQCFGLTGSVTKIDADGPARIIDGLPSFANDDGSGASGPQGIAVDERGVHVTIGLGSDVDLATRADVFGPDGEDLGSLTTYDEATGARIGSVDLLAFEVANNPDGENVDTNPFDVEIYDTDGLMLVADAGGNSLLKVDITSGDVQTLATFAPSLVPAPPFLGLPPGAEIPSQAVPTSSTATDEGIFVTQLTGFPFPIGGSNVFRVPQGGGEPEIAAEGFTNVSDAELGPDGSAWVLELAKNSLVGEPGGRLIRIHPDGTREVAIEEGLFFPTGLAVDEDGWVYITNCGVCPGGGEVLLHIPDNDYVAYTSGNQEVPAIGGDAWSWSEWRLHNGGTRIDFSATIFDLDGIQAAHLHLGPRGENGPVAVDLTDAIVSNGRLKGSITAADLVGPLEGLTIADLVIEIDAGNIYLNVHTTSVPSGQIRGQLVDW